MLALMLSNFAAKLHEVSITLSLSAIILNYVQYELLNGKGVPLGSLFAPFQISNLSLLWSPGLWTINYTNSSKLRHLFLLILIVLSVTLASMAGPSSAILMMPSLGFWNQPLLYQDNILSAIVKLNGSTQIRYFVSTQDADLWPSLISNANSYPNNCDLAANPAREECPLGGFSTLLELATPSWYMNEQSLWNFTLQSVSTAENNYNRYMEGAISFQLQATQASFITQTTSLFTGNLLAEVNAWSGSLPDETENSKMTLSISNGQVLAPFVQTTCLSTGYLWVNGSIFTTGPYNFTSIDAPFDTVLSNISEITFPILDSNQTWSSDALALLSIWNSSTSNALLWSKPPELGVSTPSIAVVFAEYTNATSAQILSCSVYASWQPVEIYINPMGNNFVHADYSPTTDISTLASTRVLSEEPDYLALYSKDPIKIDTDWAQISLPPNQTLGELVRKSSRGSEFAILTDLAFGVCTSIFLTDVISRVGAQNTVLFSVDASNKTGPFIEYFNMTAVDTPGVDLTDASTHWVEAGQGGDYAEFQIGLLRYGYSYSMQGLTRRVAAGILLAHVLVATVYIVLIVWCGWRCYGLRSLIDIVVLAISSPGSKSLDGTFTWRVEESNVYRSIAKVREVDNGRLGFVLDGDENENGEKVAVGKLYDRMGVVEEKFNRMDEEEEVCAEVKKVEVESGDFSSVLEA